MAFYICVAFVICMTAAFRTILLQKQEKLFLLVAMAFGCYLCVCQPLTTRISLDDQIHYALTLYVVQSHKAELSAADRVMTNIAFGEASLSEANRKAAIQELEQLDKAGQYTFEYRNSSLPLLMGHIPMAVGIWTGKILKLPFAWTFILGRMGNLLVYVAVIYLSMRRLINGKLIVMSITLLPTALFLASNYSYDPWVTAFSALGCAYFMGALQRPEEKLGGFEAAVIMASFLLAIFPKANYFPLTLIPLLIPEEKFLDATQKRRFRICAVSVFAMSLAVCVLPMLVSAIAGGTEAISDYRGGSDINGVEQIRFILNHPVAYTRILLRFFRWYFSFENSPEYTTFFAYLGWTGRYALPIVTIIAAVIVDCRKDDALSDNWKVRFGGAASAFMAMCFGITAIYITFNPVMSETIAGTQPRYLLPVLTPLYLLTCSNRKCFRSEKNGYGAVVCAICTYTMASTCYQIIVKNIIP